MAYPADPTPADDKLLESDGEYDEMGGGASAQGFAAGGQTGNYARLQQQQQSDF